MPLTAIPLPDKNDLVVEKNDRNDVCLSPTTAEYILGFGMQLGGLVHLLTEQIMICLF